MPTHFVIHTHTRRHTHTHTAARTLIVPPTISALSHRRQPHGALFVVVVVVVIFAACL